MAYPRKEFRVPYHVAPWVADFDSKMQRSMPTSKLEPQDQGRPWNKLEQSSSGLTSLPQPCEDTSERSSNSGPEQPRHVVKLDHQQQRLDNHQNSETYPSHIFESESQELALIASGSGRQERVQAPPGLSAPRGRRLGIIPALQNGVSCCLQRPKLPPPASSTRISSPPPCPTINQPSTTESTREQPVEAKQGRETKVDNEYKQRVTMNGDEFYADQSYVTFSDRANSISSQSSDESSWDLISSIYRLAGDWEDVDEGAQEESNVTDRVFEGYFEYDE